NVFSFTVGIFVLSIFTFVSGIFMVGEKGIGPFRESYIKRAKLSHIIMVIAGGCVFLIGEMSGLSLGKRFLQHPVALTAIILATASHIVLWKLFDISRAWRLRILTGFQLLMVVGAWLAVIFPDVIFYANGTTLSLLSHTAPEKTLFMLCLALIIGAAIFLPLLVYLFFVFKKL
ncbi:MAG: cytochrome d ubiquinol oxidase subunit II, partial [Candidatus Omnitrophica bacterium]|nr:cytochrome d ubiquinol oxidase subunit II [Candidatus Omnitrophota bacterium]